MSVQPIGPQIPSFNKFTWKITNFTKLTETSYYSRAFTIGINRWKILFYPKGYNNPGHLSLFVAVADSTNLPNGWTRSVMYSLTVVNQRTANSSLKREISHKFCASELSWGFPTMITQEKVHNDGFLVNDTVILEACFDLLEAVVPLSTEMDSYFSSLEKYISRVKDVPECSLRSPSDARSLTLEEVENAKRSLKECLSGPFRLNMKDRLAEMLSTLSRAEVGLSVSQLSSVRAFRDRFGDFTSDFIKFEQGNAAFEQNKLLRDQMFSKMKEGHEKHIMLKRLSGEIRKEKEECERKMKEICRRKEKLDMDWDVVLAKSQEAMSKYIEHEKKVKDDEEKKRIAEESMSRLILAWSELQAEFA